MIFRELHAIVGHAAGKNLADGLIAPQRDRIFKLSLN